MPAYTVAATAVTLGVPIKWVDNVLSHHQVPGVSQKRQGVSRRLAPQAVLALEIALRISNALGVPTSRGLELSGRLLRHPTDTATVELGQGISISIDLGEIRSELLERLAHAVEVAPSPRRGRPPGS
jgi:hypothetical protein